MKFLSGNEYTQAVKDALQSGQDLRAPVAFWGNGAEEWLRPGSNAMIICNLESGATNPGGIGALLTTAKVRSHHRLHAKVVITDGAIIIGSANISANGLSPEGEATLAGWKEADVRTTDRKMREEALGVGAPDGHFVLVDDVIREARRRLG